MFEPGTILRLRDPQSTDDNPYPYDYVEVVGQSPIQHVSSSGSVWAGADATGFIIKPAGDGFAATLDKPLGELNSLYEVDSYPTDPQTGKPLVPESNPRNLPSPEQVFAQQAAASTVAKQRAKVPSVQDDAKSPEQVLREAGEQPQSTRRKPKEKTSTDE